MKRCSPLKVNIYFGGTCSLHLQGRRISQARNKLEEGRNATLNGLHGGICEKKELFLED
jgi:hypothetical protein